MSRHTRRGLVAVLAAMGLVLAACGDDDEGADADAQGDEQAAGASGAAIADDPCAPDALETTELRLATSPPEFDTITDAKWLELLEDVGLSIETFEFETSPDTVRAVAAGEGDLVNTSPLAIMQYIQESSDGLDVIAVELLKTDYFLVAASDVEELEDLEGRVVGISEPGDLSDSLTRLLFEKANVDTSGMEFAEIGGTAARMAALGAGQIDAGAAHAADGLAAAEEFDLNVVARYVDRIPDYAQRFLAGSPDWLEDNPNVAQCVVDKLIEAQRWAMDNRDEYVELGLSLVEGLPRPIAEEVYDLFHDEGFFAVNGGMDKIEPTMQVEVDQGNLEEGGSMEDLSSWVDPSYVERSLERLGEYEE